MFWKDLGVLLTQDLDLNSGSATLSNVASFIIFKTGMILTCYRIFVRTGDMEALSVEVDGICQLNGNFYLQN